MILAIIGITLFIAGFFPQVPSEIIYIGAILTPIGAFIACRQKSGGNFNAFH